ncbi:MAG: glutamate racemase [Candidatus Gottesmanbacteria bacterium]|nr:glutamate racemase [Candidatus Gottesmanbacteria bacterium]
MEKPSTAIGILDSGFGGLSVYQSISALLPHESTVYIGDHAYLPYGEKSVHVIQQRMLALIRFLIHKHAKLIVIACNTGTVAGIELYRTTFPDVPIVGVVPVIKTAAALSNRKRFAVLSTKFTAGSAYQKYLIEEFANGCIVHNLWCPNLVPLVEQGVVSGPAVEKELRWILTPKILSDIDVIALGCTHYPFLTAAIRAIVGNDITVLDSGGAVSRQVARILEHNGMKARTKKPTYTFFSTGTGHDYSPIASLLLRQNVHVAYADI